MLARLSALLALLLLTAAVWWWWPVRPRVAWEASEHLWKMQFAANGQAVVLSHWGGLTFCDVANGASTPISTGRFGSATFFQIADDGATVAFDEGSTKLWHPSGTVVSIKCLGGLQAVAGQKVIISVDTADMLEVHVHGFQGQRLHSQVYTSVRRLQTLPLADRVLELLYFPDRKKVQVVDLATGRVLFDLTPFEPGLADAFDAKLAAMLSPDGQRLATLGRDGITVHLLATGAQECFISHAAEQFVPCKFNADGSMFATYRWNGPGKSLAVRLWRIRFGQPEPLHDLAEEPKFSPKVRQYLARVWPPGEDMPRPPEWFLCDSDSQRTFSLGSALDSDCTFAPDSRTLAVKESIDPSRLGSWLGQRRRDGVRLLDGQSGQLLPWFREGTKFAYFPDGRSLAILNGERLEVWDVDARRPWWVEWGLPMVFCGLSLGAIGVMRRTATT